MGNQETLHQPSTDGPSRKVNPWLHIWTRTGESIAFAVRFWLEDYIHRLFMAAGLAFVLGARIPTWIAETPHPIGVMIQVLLVAPIGGLMIGYVLAAVTRNIAERFKVGVEHRIMRVYVAWTSLPFVLAWTLLWVMYAVLNMTQPEDVRQTFWLLEGTIGWVPVMVAGAAFLWAVVIRIRGLAALLGKNFGQAALIWFISSVVTYSPVIFFSLTYYTIFRTTVGNAIGGG